MPRLPRLPAAAAGFALLAAAGCGGSGLHPVAGRVVYPDGRPVTAGRVVLDTGPAFTGSWGGIRPDGTFVMGTKTPDDGVPAGRWRVYLVNTELPPPEGSLAPPTQLVHPRYADPDTAGLAFDVPAQTDWQIVVDPPPAAPARRR